MSVSFAWEGDDSATLGHQFHVVVNGVDQGYRAVGTADVSDATREERGQV